MTATNKPLYIEQGATFDRGFTWRGQTTDLDGNVIPGDPHDITGWTARMQIRPAQGGGIILEATTENGRLVLNEEPGRVRFNFSTLVTGALTHATGVYDLELVDPDGKVYRLLEGTVTISPNITQAPGEPVLQ